MQLKDGTEVILRPMTEKDKDKLHEFFHSLPEDDKLYLRDDVDKKETIEKWVKNLDYDRVLPILAEIGGKIVGDATLHRPAYGWMSHVGSIRIVVDKRFRKKGLGTLLAREIFYQALKVGLEKLVAEMASKQSSAIKVFDALGFHQEALLQKHIVDSKGRKHDLVIMANDVEDLWKKIQDAWEESFPSHPKE